MTRTSLLSIAALLLNGCAHYTTPGGSVSLGEFVDEDIQEFYAATPASQFPAGMAVIRVQDKGYSQRTSNYSQGRFEVVTARDVETDEALQKLQQLTYMRGVAPVGRLLLPSAPDSLRDLRVPAARLQADMLLVYTVDTVFTVDGKSLGPLSLVSLEFLPNHKAHVTATVSGVLIDVRTGFIYGTAEASSTEVQRSSMWSTRLAVESARGIAEQQAFDSFVDEFGLMWNDVLAALASIYPTRLVD